MAAREAAMRRRAGVALDTSCVIPLLCGWHEYHATTARALGAAGSRFVISTHVLLESFAVLTRLPAPCRLAPSRAQELLKANFGTGGVVCEVSQKDCWSAIHSTAALGSGRVYDAVIAHSTARAGASVLVTWNVKDFLAVAPSGLEIRAPSQLSVE